MALAEKKLQLIKAISELEDEHTLDQLLAVFPEKVQGMNKKTCPKYPAKPKVLFCKFHPSKAIGEAPSSKISSRERYT